MITRSSAGRASYRFGFMTVAFVFGLVMAFSTAPSPLYGLYARRDGFSPFTITLIYAAYAVGVAASLFLAGHLSDTRGRRPLLLIAVGLAVCADVLFLVWPALPGLFAARVVCGLAVGLTASTSTAYLTELFLAHRPAELIGRAQLTASAASLVGIGAGALVAGLLAQYAGHPLTIPYLVFLAAFVLVAICLAVAPETRQRPERLPPYHYQRIAVPGDARPRFFAALLGVALAFAVLGMFVGLAGTFLAGSLHRTSLALAGSAVFLVFLAGTVVVTLTGGWPVRRMLGLGVALMMSGLGLLVLAAWLTPPSLGVFLVSGAVIGAGGAAVFKGTLGVVAEISPPGRLAESLAGFYLAGYGGLSVPVIGLGVALREASVRASLLGFAIVVAAGILAATPVLAGAPGRAGAELLASSGSRGGRGDG